MHPINTIHFIDSLLFVKHDIFFIGLYKNK